MIQLGPSTVDRAETIITAHFVVQMRLAKKKDSDAVYVDLNTLKAYAAECACGYRKNLRACKDLADHEILYRSVHQLLDPTSLEYANAIK